MSTLTADQRRCIRRYLRRLEEAIQRMNEARK